MNTAQMETLRFCEDWISLAQETVAALETTIEMLTDRVEALEESREKGGAG